MIDRWTKNGKCYCMCNTWMWIESKQLQRVARGTSHCLRSKEITFTVRNKLEYGTKCLNCFHNVFVKCIWWWIYGVSKTHEKQILLINTAPVWFSYDVPPLSYVCMRDNFNILLKYRSYLLQQILSILDDELTFYVLKKQMFYNRGG